MVQTINYEINNPYSQYTECFVHEFDNYVIDIHFYIDGQKFEVDLSSGSNYSISVNITIDNILVAEGISGIAVPGDNTGLRINLIHGQGISVFPGLMKVEFIIQDNESNPHRTICPVAPLLIRVKPSILNEALVLPESIGNVAELIRLYPTLNNIVNNGVQTSQIADNAVASAKLADEAVTSGKIADEAVTLEKLASDVTAQLNNKMVSAFVVGSSTVFNEYTAFNRVYYTTVNDIDYRFYVVLDYQNNLKAQFRESVNGIEKRVYDSENTAWGLWSNICDNYLTNTSGSVSGSNIASGAISSGKLAAGAVGTAKIANGAVTYDKLSTELQETIDIVPATPLFISNKGALSTALTFNSADYCVVGAVYQFAISGALASEVGIQVEQDNSKPCEMRYVNGYQVITQTDTQQIFSRKVNTVAPTFSADNWAEVIHPAITALQSRVTVLESANAILQNAINGVS